jgi:hypothetical protein
MKASSWIMVSVYVSMVSPRLVRQCPGQASRLSGTYLPDDFSPDAWRGHCLTGRGDR